MNPLVSIKDRLHDNEVNVPAEVGHFDAVHTVEVGDCCVRVAEKVLVIVGHDATEEARFGVGLGLDHVSGLIGGREGVSCKNETINKF